MKNIIRAMFIPFILIALFIFAIVTSNWFYPMLISIGLLVYEFIFYSGRKQRIRYYIQRYNRELRQNNYDENVAINAIKIEFCSSKFSDKNICTKKYNNIEILLQDIIDTEFNLKSLLKLNKKSPHYIYKIKDNIDLYINEKKRVEKEINDILVEQKITK